MFWRKGPAYGRKWGKNPLIDPRPNWGSLIVNVHHVKARWRAFAHLNGSAHFFLSFSEDAATLFLFVLTALFAIEPDVVTRFAKSCFAVDQLLVRVAALFADFITEDF